MPRNYPPIKTQFSRHEKVTSFVLLVTVTDAAYADKDAKANKIKPSNAAPKPGPAADTVWYGAGKEHAEFGIRIYDTRVGRDIPVDIDSTTAAKYGATRPAKGSNLYTVLPIIL